MEKIKKTKTIEPKKQEGLGVFLLKLIHKYIGIQKPVY
ncbi:MAG: hypothetical protein ACJA08_001684 [Cyclobacteriaceae bacterium]|jgi:hypothetical protein